MASGEITSTFARALDEVRAWLEKMITALRFVELVAAILALVGRLRDLNTELIARVSHLRRARPGESQIAVVALSVNVSPSPMR